MNNITRTFILLFTLFIYSSGHTETNLKSIKRINSNKSNKFNAVNLSKISNNVRFDSHINQNNLRKSKQSNQVGKLDSAIYFQQDIEKKYSLNFNDNGLITVELIQWWDNEKHTWQNDYRLNYEYNQDGLEITSELENYNAESSTWMKDWRYLSDYLDGGNKIILWDQEWNTNNNSWDSWWKQTTTFSEFSTSFLEEVWDNVENTWINDYKAVINYDASGNELNYFGEAWDTESSQWVDSWKDTTFYDELGRPIGYKSYFSSNGQWYAWDNESYYYDVNGYLVEYLVRDIDQSSGEWIEYTRTTFTYDSNGNLLTEFLDNLDPMYYNYRTTYQYDADGNMVYAKNEEVDPVENTSELVTSGIYFSDMYTRYSFDASELSAYYSIPTFVEYLSTPLSNKFSLDQNYPNPFNPATTISYTIPSNVEQSGNTLLKIYDLLGNEIETLVNEIQKPGSYKVTFNAKYLSSGTYFYRISIGDFRQTKRMVLVK